MKLASLILCLLCCAGLKSNAQTADPKQTEEYTNLVTIIDAYQQNQPAKVRDLQTSVGKRLCDEFYAKPWFFKLPSPELIGFEDKSRHVGIFMLHEHHLIFVFKNTKNPALEGQIFSVTFFKEHNVWCFHDIIYDNNKFAAANFDAVANRLGNANSAARDLMVAASTVMHTAPNDWSRFHTAIAEVQEKAVSNGFGQSKDVQEFIFAAQDLETFATKWKQVIEIVSTDKSSDTLTKNIAAKVQAAYNGTLPTGGMEAESKLQEEIKNEIESTLRQSIQALDPKDAEEYGQLMNKLRKAYDGILNLIHN